MYTTNVMGLFRRVLRCLGIQTLAARGGDTYIYYGLGSCILFLLAFGVGYYTAPGGVPCSDNRVNVTPQPLGVKTVQGEVDQPTITSESVQVTPDQLLVATGNVQDEPKQPIVTNETVQYTPSPATVVNETADGTKQLNVTKDNGNAKYKDLPHVNECNFCFKCHLLENPPPLQSLTMDELNEAAQELQRKKEGRRRDNRRRKLSDSRKDLPVAVDDRSTLPNCTECYGCTHILRDLDTNATAFNRTFRMGAGGSSAHILLASGPQLTNEAVVKVWCVPLTKRFHPRIAKCKSNDIMKSSRVQLIIQRLVDECGFEDIVSRVWVAPVNGIIEGVGFHVDTFGLWSELAPGLSLFNIASQFPNLVGNNPIPGEVVLDVLQNRVNKTEVMLAAMFDVFTSQCDRHAENVFFTESGKLTLIDNDQSLTNSWRQCGIDSLFIPTTQKYQINHLGYYYIMKQHNRSTLTPNIQLLLDYQCHVENGTIGKDYPPRLAKCMDNLRRMSIADIQEKYGIVNSFMARALVTRSTDMLGRGFEWTVKYGEPLNPRAMVYGWEKPCCRMELLNRTLDDLYSVGDEFSRRFMCTTPWEPNMTLPAGDPYYGANGRKQVRL